MIERLIEYCCRNRLLVVFAFLGVTTAGVWVMRRTPIDAIPDLSENQVIVFTDWMGRSPREIEDQITYPLSVNLQGLAGVKTVRSSSEFNFSMINIIFDDSVDFYFARTRVLERLTLAGTFLPPGVAPYLAPDATALGQIYWYTVEGNNQDLGTLRAVQDWLVRYQLNSVPGVAQVASVGGFPREYQVDVTPEKLRAYNVTLGQIFSAVQAGNSAVGGRVVQKGNAEYLIRGVGWIASLDDIRDTVVAERGGFPIRVGDVATVQMGPEFRRSVLEKDGREVTGGVVMMRYGENPLEVTQRVKAKIRELQKGLPEGVRILPFYDRTRLIESAVHTVERVLEHEILIAAIAILLILAHVRSVFIVVLTLPLSILIAFILMRAFGISSNIMSLSGIAISIGILVDQSIVMLENATHRLTAQFPDRRVRGDTTEIVAAACRQVGRPIFFSVVIMVISFLPVFALTGQEGRMFHPLAFTKTFALVGTAIVSVTLVPALIPLLVRGRLAREEDNWIVRSVQEMYRPVLGYLMGRPRTVVWLFAILLAFGFYLARHLGREFMPPLDEGSVMDMPVTAPRASVTEVTDDLKARDALLRSLPEVELVVGKGGRADTATDPSPLDMIETVVNLRPRELWLKRKLHGDDVWPETQRVAALLERSGALAAPAEGAEARGELLESVASGALDRYDAAMRLDAMQRQMEFDAQLARDSVAFVVGRVFDRVRANGAWASHPSATRKEEIVATLTAMYAATFERPELAHVDEAVAATVQELRRGGLLKPGDADPLAPPASRWGALAEVARDFAGAERLDFAVGTAQQLARYREAAAREWTVRTNREIFAPAMKHFESALLASFASEADMRGLWHDDKPLPDVAALARDFGERAFLWQPVKSERAASGGAAARPEHESERERARRVARDLDKKSALVNELDRFVRQVGWANIWTQPIINRVDMLATGVRTQLAVKVYGKSEQQIQDVSNAVADVLRGIPGASDVVADQSVGKGYVEIAIDRERASRYGINVGDVQDVIEVALGGKVVTTTVEGRERYPVRVRYARDFREDEESIRRILVSGGADRSEGAAQPAIYLGDVADVKVVEGPVMIKSENGLLRAYVQLNVRDRDIVGFVEEAQRLVAAQVQLPEGTFLAWTGQFESQVRARNALRIVFPAVLLLIFLILYVTYHDLTHAVLMMLAVPGALAGGVIFQWLFGYNFSVAVWVGYIACFGMATETGIIMLVYLRDAIAERGGLAGIGSLEALKEAVMAGAIHRLRPKLLTEGTAIVGLAPMLWASGTGAEVIAPMAAPVLGGLLIADEVIDIFLPVLFYHVEARRWRREHGPGQPTLRRDQ